jgi:hypothetical protein
MKQQSALLTFALTSERLLTEYSFVRIYSGNAPIYFYGVVLNLVAVLAELLNR